MPVRRPVGDVTDPEPLRGSTADPEFRRKRAALAARAQHSLDAYVNRIIRDAADLTDEHFDQLRALFADRAQGGDNAA